jgi:phage recombination protein Bet
MATQPGTHTADPSTKPTQQGVRDLFEGARGGPLALPDTPSVEWLQATLTASQIKTLLATVAPKATDDELAVFLWTSRRRGLDPFLKQVHFVKRRRRAQNDRGEWGYEEYAVHQTGIDGLRVIANRARADAANTRLLAGIKRGAIRDVDGKLTGGWAEVYRHDWTQPAREEVDFEEYVQRNDKGATTGLWTSKPETMIKKCAEAAALRMAFPEDLGDLYIDEEMDAAEHIAPRHRPEEPPVSSATAARGDAFPSAAAPAPAPPPPVVIDTTATRVEPAAAGDDVWNDAEPGAPPTPSPDPKDPRPGTVAELVKVIGTFQAPPAADKFFALTKARLGTGFTTASAIVPAAVDAAALDDFLGLLRDLKAGKEEAKAAYRDALKKGGYQAPAAKPAGSAA